VDSGIRVNVGPRLRRTTFGMRLLRRPWIPTFGGMTSLRFGGMTSLRFGGMTSLRFGGMTSLRFGGMTHL
jgi:hypothetical protein